MAGSPKKQKLSQRKLSGAASYNENSVHAMSALLTKGKQMISDIVMMQTTSSVKLENTSLRSSFDFTKNTGPLLDQLCCRGLDSRLTQCTQSKVKLLKFETNLWSENFPIYILFVWSSFSYLGQTL